MCAIHQLKMEFYNKYNNQFADCTDCTKSIILDIFNGNRLFDNEVSNPHILNALGIYFSDVALCDDKAVHYLTLAISSGSSHAMVNIGLYYREKDADKAVHYFEMAISCGNARAMVFLGAHHGSIANFEKSITYLSMAIANGLINPTIVGLIDQTVDHFPISAYKGLVCTDHPMLSQLKCALETNKHVIAYKNKVQLFTRLDNIEECIKCSSVELCICLDCGHTMCTNCYPKYHLHCSECT